MSLDFNTPEPQRQKLDNLSTVGSVFNDSNPTMDNQPFDAVYKVSRAQVLLLVPSLCFSLLALGAILYALSHTPKSEPVLIQCDPDILEKIEKQAKFLEEIAKKSGK